MPAAELKNVELEKNNAKLREDVKEGDSMLDKYIA